MCSVPASPELVVHRGIKIRKRGRRWRWQVRLEGRNVVGSGATLEEAIGRLDSALGQREESRRQQGSVQPGALTISELCDRWFRSYQARLAPATAYQYSIHIRVHIGEGIGPLDANTIKPRELQSFYDSLRWKPAKESHHILRKAFAWGLLNGDLWREGNPALVARPSRRACIDHDGFYDEEATIHPVDEKEVPRPPEVEKLLVDAETDPTWWLYLKLAAATGARPGEICALQRKHVDLDRGTLRIEWSSDRVGGRVKRPKSPWSIRTLPLAPSLLEAIAPVLPDDPEAYLFPSNTQAGASSPLPCWNSRSVKRKLDKALERTGLPHYTPHAFRHFVATYLLAEGCSTTQVARFLGHANDSEVRQRYANHLVDEAQRRIGELASGLVPDRSGIEGDTPHDV